MGRVQTALCCLALALALQQIAESVESVGGMDESAIGSETTVDEAQGAKADAATCECADSKTWASPDNGRLCSTYRIGGVNEGYCDLDEAYTACPSACDSCPACSGVSDVSLTAMLWLGLPCVMLAFCAPFLKTVLFYLKDDRITIQQAEKEATIAAADASHLLGPAPPLRTGSSARPDANLLREAYGGASHLPHDQMANEINQRALPLFQQMDKNGTGTIEFAEFEQALNGALGNLGYPPEHMVALFNQADADKSGSIDYQKFCQNLMAIHSAHQQEQMKSKQNEVRQQGELGV